MAAWLEKLRGSLRGDNQTGGPQDGTAARPSAAFFLDRARQTRQEIRNASTNQAFMTAIKAGDQARNERRWPQALAAYEEALTLVGCHHGYLVQLAHMHKETGQFAAAEIAYRDALAYGAWPDDVWEHLEFVARRGGLTGPLYSLEITSRLEQHGGDRSTDPLAGLDLVTAADVTALATVLIGGGPWSAGQILAWLRQGSVLDQLLVTLVADERFARANLPLLRLRSQQASQKANQPQAGQIR
jgi:tetratricopeptide (TPR) repeat protein